MQLAFSITGTAGEPAEIDQFTATAKILSRYRRETIKRLTIEQLPLRRAAYAFRRVARGPSKLARRMRRHNELGRAGSF